MNLLFNWAKEHIYLVVVLITGLALRLYHLTAISLWHDEAFSALLIKYPWGEMMYRIGLDVHPPMYYIFLRLWYYILGNSLWSLRGFSVLFGVGLIIISYKFVKDAFNSQRAALIVALLVAVNPFQISYVTEARMYTMGASFAVLAAWALYRALTTQRSYYGDEKLNMPNLPQDIRQRRQFLIYYALFAVSTIVIIYTHYYLLFTAAAIGFFGLLYHWHAYKDKVKRYGWLILSFAVIGLSYLPWLKIFLYQLKQVGGGYWIPPMDRWSIPDTLWRMLIGLYTDGVPNHLLLTVTTIVIVAVLLFVLRRTQNFAKWSVSLNVIAPFAGAVLFALMAKLQGDSSSVYLVRYFLFSSPFFLMMVALWLEEFRPRKVAQVLLILLIAINLFAFFKHWSSLDVKNHLGMAAAAKFFDANVEPQHKFYVGSSFEFFNLKYYLDRYGHLESATFPQPKLFSGGITDIKQLPHYAGTAILTNDDLLPDFKAATQNGDTVWLLWTNGFGGSKPSVPANWTQIDEKAWSEIRPYLGTWIIITQYKVN